MISNNFDNFYTICCLSQDVCFSATTTCGVPVHKPKLSSTFRIVGGMPAVANSWPWQVYLSIDDITIGCGAALITDQWLDNPKYVAYLGAHIRPSKAPKASKAVPITKVIRHPKYKRTALNILNDIALVKLQKPVKFTDKILPVCLPTSFLPSVNKSAIVVGWGSTSDKSIQFASDLIQVQVPIRSFDYCKLNDTISKGHQICAGDDNIGEEKDACVGDSGSPMVMLHKKKFFLVGVVSFGGQICGGRGIYTNVYDYMDWINSEIFEKDSYDYYDSVINNQILDYNYEFV